MHGNVKHGMARRGHKYPTEYIIWGGMRQRCTNVNNSDYPNYGGRGITVCSEWDDFAQFYADMGDRPSNHHSIERVDNDGPYSKENCVWATTDIQNNNKRMHGGKPSYEYMGRKMTLASICKETNMPWHAIWARVNRMGLSVEQAVAIPIQPRLGRKKLKHLQSA